MNELEELIKQEIPMEFLKGILLELPNAYKKSYLNIDNEFNTKLTKDILPYYRRCKVDEALLFTAQRFGLDTELSLNKANNCRHVTVKTNKIILTANLVSGPSEMVRRAIFRKTLAESNEGCLFPEFDDRPRGDSVYAMILHGPSTLKSSRVGFVWLGVPSFDSKYYLYRFNLADYCNIDLYPLAAEENVQDTANTSLRRNKSSKKGGGE